MAGDQQLQSWQELSQDVPRCAQRIPLLEGPVSREQRDAGAAVVQGGGSRQGQLSDASTVAQAALPHFHPVEVSGNMLKPFSTLLEQITRN